MVAIKNMQTLIVQLVFIIKQIKPEKYAGNLYQAYIRKICWKFDLIIVFMHCRDDFFKGNVWGQSQQYMSCFNDEAISTCRQSLARTIQHILSNTHQNCSEIVSVDEIMGNKTKVTIGQRIFRSSRNKASLHKTNFVCSSVHSYQPW